MADSCWLIADHTNATKAKNKAYPWAIGIGAVAMIAIEAVVAIAIVLGVVEMIVGGAVA